MANKKQEKKLDELDLKEIREELTSYIKGRVDEEVEKSTKKLIRYKNSIILRRNFTILVLFAICCLLAYNLYSISNINIDISTNKNVKKVNEEVKKQEEVEDYSRYNYLFDNISISENSSYIKDYYDAKLDDKIKEYLIMNKIDDEKIHSEDGSIYIDKNDLEEVYNNTYTTEFNPSSFTYNKLKFNYLASKEIYIADGEFKREESNVVREIISVNENDETLEVITVEAVYKDKKLYNVKTGNEVDGYDGKIINLQDKLTKLKYIFKNVDDVYKLDNIELEK